MGHVSKRPILHPSEAELTKQTCFCAAGPKRLISVVYSGDSFDFRDAIQPVFHQNVGGLGGNNELGVFVQ